MEYINKDSFYTAFVVADTACVLFRVNAKEFMDFTSTMMRNSAIKHL